MFKLYTYYTYIHTYIHTLLYFTFNCITLRYITYIHIYIYYYAKDMRYVNKESVFHHQDVGETLCNTREPQMVRKF